MSLRKVQFVQGEIYHLYNRGNHKRQIFLDNQDYIRFQRLLYLSNGSSRINVRDVRESKTDFYDFDSGLPLVAIGAYCVMPNHYHLLVTPLVEDGISLFMKKLGTSYSMYFNKRYRSSGSLFEGKFKSVHAGDDVYLRHLYSYIHLNALKLLDSAWQEKGLISEDRAKNYLENYQYSSFRDYLGFQRPERAILSPENFPDYIKNPAEAREGLYSWFSPAKV